MNRVVNDDDIDSLAAGWAVRLDADDLNDAERQALEAWLEADVRHVGALVRAQAVWVDLDRVAALRAGDPPPIERSRAAGVRRPTMRLPSPKRRMAAAAAAIMTLGAVATGAWTQLDGRHAASRGEIRWLSLEDGSTVILNSGAVVQVKFSPGERTVYLRKGEASFQVAHDKARPFLVHARNVAVRAVGTSFAVRLQPDQVRVTVAEGVVEVKRRDGPVRRIERQLVARDAELVAESTKPLPAPAPVSDAEIARKLAWRDGLLVFDGERIAAASVEVNQYAARPVVIDDPKLGQAAFVGVFRLGDSKAFADSVAAAYDDRVVERDDGLHIAPR